MVISKDDVKKLFMNVDLSEEETVYLKYHIDRLAYTTNIIQLFCNKFKTNRILDIGPHFLTRCIKKFIKPELSISTLGWINERLVSSDLYDEHIQFDLNDCDKGKVEFRHQPFDLIVFSETIEHLYTSPLSVISFLKTFLKPEKGGLLIQTPNAVALDKRIKMFMGKNPYELIRVEKKDFGHFREYTMHELLRYGFEQNLSVWRKEYCNYWASTNKVFNFLEKTIPSFRRGITLIFIT